MELKRVRHSLVTKQQQQRTGWFWPCLNFSADLHIELCNALTVLQIPALSVCEECIGCRLRPYFGVKSHPSLMSWKGSCLRAPHFGAKPGLRIISSLMSNVLMFTMPSLWYRGKYSINFKLNLNMNYLFWILSEWTILLRGGGKKKKRNTLSD